jgi:hypothetical protein
MHTIQHTNPDGTVVDVRIGDGAVIGDEAVIGDAGLRLDGRRFHVFVPGGATEPIVSAGCRYFTLAEARAHWGAETYPNRSLGDETLAILDHAERVLRLRGVLKTTEVLK